MADHKSFISSLNILFNKEHEDFSFVYWITKLHKNPYRENNTTGASSFSTNYLFINMAIHIVTAFKEGILSYWDKVYSRSSFNHIWILKYCKDNCNSRSFSEIFSSKHVTFLHFRNSFLLGMYKHAYKYHLYYKCIYHQNGKKCYKLIVFGHELTYFILSSTKKEKNRYTQIWVTTNLEFRIDDIFAELGGHVCQQLVLYINTTYGLSQGLYLSLYDEWH